MSDAILKWFKPGKQTENAKAALRLLAASEAQGFWIPHASRKVRAALSKTGVAETYARKWEREHSEWERAHGSRQLGSRTFDATHVLEFGMFERAQTFDWIARIKISEHDHQREIFNMANDYAASFEDIARRLQELDETRPQPVITSLGVSPRVTGTLTELGLVPSTVRMCPGEWRKFEGKNKRGEREVVWMYVLIWPANVLHKQSRFFETVNNQQCQACGHAIKNVYNWVPLLIDGTDGVPRSLWVGTDCAKNLFGVKIKGEMRYEGENR